MIFPLIKFFIGGIIVVVYIERSTAHEFATVESNRRKKTHVLYNRKFLVLF